MEKPKCILLISGKRKCGKDYISEKLKNILEDSCIVRISEPIKGYYANQLNLDLKELMSDGPYKENHRKAMILWSDEVRSKVPGYFCEAACKKAVIKEIWIVSDIRRKTDIEWFKSEYGNKIKTIRIIANEDVRKNRGWIFTEGVDDVTSECDLDDFEDWNLKISNNNESECNESLQKIKNLIDN